MIDVRRRFPSPLLTFPLCPPTTYPLLKIAGIDASAYDPKVEFKDPITKYEDING
jgi:hypothetical protein